MGEVYRGRDTRLDRIVAIKVVSRRGFIDPEFRSRFEREARHIAALNHSRICTLYDVGHQDDISFLVMEYLEGETLAVRLLKGALPLEQTLKVGIEICDALVSAHRHGIVHRDLKPANVMLTKSGAKLLDFGLAKTVTPDADEEAIADPLSATQSRLVSGDRSFVGTLPYMAPEQIDGRRVDDRTDIFAFGAVVYEMSTGTKAFDGDDRTSVIVQVLDRDPVPLSVRLPSAPPAFARIVTKCLAKDPDARWQTARDLLDELKWVDATRGGIAVATNRTVSWRRPALLMLGAMAIAATAGLSGYILRSPRAPVARLALLPPENSLFANYAVSPDGSRIVYAAQANQTLQLWVRAFDTTGAQPLAGTTDPHDPVWSPDGQSIAFFADGKLKKISPSGGPVQTLCDAPAGRGASWGTAGVIVFAPNILGGLSKVPATGGKPVPVTTVDAARHEDSHRHPFFLPDGRHFLFIARSDKRENSTVDIGSIDSTERSHLLNVESKTAYSAPGYVLFLDDGTRGNLMALPFDARSLRATGEAVPVDDRLPYDVATFSASSTGILAYTTSPAHRLVWFSRSGTMLSTATSPDRIEHIALSPDDTRVAMSRWFQGNQDVWVFDLVRGAMSRVTFNPARDGHPIWSADGARVVFSSSRGPTTTIFATQASGGGTEETLLASDQSIDPTDWSSDGRFLVFGRQDPATLNDVWALPLAGDRKAFPVVESAFMEERARLSPDSRWIAYMSNESGNWEVYLRNFPESKERWQVSVGGGAQPQWRHDGRELYYLDPKSVLHAVPITLGPKMAIGRPQPLFQTRIADYAMGSAYAVTRDGQRFLVDNPVQDIAHIAINVILNWPAGLRK